MKYVKGVLSCSNDPILLLDCGADIGLVSVVLASTCSCIKQIVAFEPNPNSFRYLARNMDLLPIEAEAKNAAVADFVGKGELRLYHDPDDTAAFIAPSKQGNVEVTRIDDCDLADDYRILLKVDVEGGELAVIRGATRTLSRSRSFVVVFEAHRDQVKRSGIDPVETISLLKSLRPCRIRVVGELNCEVTLDKPFFDQFPDRIYNICAHSE